MLALAARTLFNPLEVIERPLVIIEDERIVRVSSRTSAELPSGAEHKDFGDSILAPGLIDIHVHGSFGYDVMQNNEPGRRKFEEFLARHGVTSYYPTTVTAPLETTLRSLERLGGTIESKAASAGTAQPLGIHLEGPFLSHVRRGAHLPEQLLPLDLRTFDRLWQASRGQIRVMTIAPELPGAAEVIAEATKRGVCVSVGHSDANGEQTVAALAAGARHATHTFNAMRPLDHRDPGILGEVLSNPSFTADLIADGIHVHPSIVRLFLEAKGEERAVLITDATAAAGMPDGRYQLGPLEVEVRDGKCLRDGKLAGSLLTLDQAIRNVMSFAGWDLQPAVRLATLNPARVAGAKGKGSIVAGADADMVVMNSSGEIQASIAKGVFVQR
jgi:N-acetylglucosamine-6-phosphate deacetylase